MIWNCNKICVHTGFCGIFHIVINNQLTADILKVLAAKNF